MEIAKAESGVSKSSSSVSEMSKEDDGIITNTEVLKSQEETCEKEALKSVKVENCLDDISDGEISDMAKVILSSKANGTESETTLPSKANPDDEKKVIEISESDESGEEVEMSEATLIKKAESATSIQKVVDQVNVVVLESATKLDPVYISKEQKSEKEDGTPEKRSTSVSNAKNDDTDQTISKTTTNEKQTDMNTLLEVTQSIIKLPQQTKTGTDQAASESTSISPAEAAINREELPILASKGIEPQKKQTQEKKQDNINNTLKEIISDIDRVIEQEYEQQEQQLHQQQLVIQQEQHAKELQRLIDENQNLMQQMQLQHQLTQPQSSPNVQNVSNYQTPPVSQDHVPTIATKSLTNEESQSETDYVKKNESYEIEESSSSVSNTVDVQKLFLPASDNEEILPKNRAELFAKRRRKAEKWIVDENNAGTESPSGVFNKHQPHKPTLPASMVPAYSDVGIHRVQMNLQQQQIQDKYSNPGFKIVKSPWEAALETGSASNAFEELNKLNGQYHHCGQYEQHTSPHISATPILLQEPSTQFTHCQPKSSPTPNSQRDLAYKPNIPQGWKAPALVLPKELYVPKEIPLESYAPPPVTSFYKPSGSYPGYQSPSAYPDGIDNKNCPDFTLSKPRTYNDAQSKHTIPKESLQKQHSWTPSAYHQQSSLNLSTPVNFNPSPLAFDKLAKFEQIDPLPKQTYQAPHHRPIDVSSTSSKLGNVASTNFSKGSSKTFNKPHYQSGFPFDQSARSSFPTSPCLKNYALGSGNESLPYSTVPAINLSHCQNFNASARGWGGSRRNEPYHPILVGPKVVGNLNYTDF